MFLVSQNSDLAKAAPVLVFDGMESLRQVTVDLDLHLLRKSSQLCKSFWVEGFETA